VIGSEGRLSRASLAAFAAAFLALGACAEGAETAEAPPNEEMLAVGQELYEASCAECHGVDLRGTDKGPSHLSEVYEPNHHADAAFLLAVQRGSRAHHWNFGDMAPVEGLDVDDVAAITAYVRSVQEEEGFEPYPP